MTDGENGEDKALLEAIAHVWKLYEQSLEGSQEHNEKMMKTFFEEHGIRYTESELAVTEDGFNRFYLLLESKQWICISCRSYRGGGMLYLN